MKERYYVPRHDKEPRGSIIKSIMDVGELYFIQIGSEEVPDWIPLGEFYEKALASFTQDDIKECLILFDREIDKNITKKKIREAVRSQS